MVPCYGLDCWKVSCIIGHFAIQIPVVQRSTVLRDPPERRLGWLDHRKSEGAPEDEVRGAGREGLVDQGKGFGFNFKGVGSLARFKAREYDLIYIF